MRPQPKLRPRCSKVCRGRPSFEPRCPLPSNRRALDSGHSYQPHVPRGTPRPAGAAAAPPLRTPPHPPVGPPSSAAQVAGAAEAPTRRATATPLRKVPARWVHPRSRLRPPMPTAASAPDSFRPPLAHLSPRGRTVAGSVPRVPASFGRPASGGQTLAMFHVKPWSASEGYGPWKVRRRDAPSNERPPQAAPG